MKKMDAPVRKIMRVEVITEDEIRRLIPESENDSEGGLKPTLLIRSRVGLGPPSVSSMVRRGRLGTMERPGDIRGGFASGYNTGARG